MPLVRILVDGYSLLHAWEDLAPGKPRHSSSARDELVTRLIQYRDAIGTPITVIFDGAGAPPGAPAAESSPELEILFSRAPKTADDLIERAAHRLKSFGNVLVVTDDHAERDIVTGFGAQAMSCDTFIRTVENELAEFGSKLQHYNRKQRAGFRKPK
jgi:predicted RNA-binding protein with PIN domain